MTDIAMQELARGCLIEWWRIVLEFQKRAKGARTYEEHAFWCRSALAEKTKALIWHDRILTGRE